MSQGNWIQIKSGQKFFFRSPGPEQLLLDDVAQGLAMNCRFNGQTKSIKHFYTVAQHSVMMSWIVPKEARLYALLHDAAEAYCSDVPRPMKADLQPGFGRIEDAIIDAILRKISYFPTLEVLDLVKTADNFMALWEAKHLLSNTDLIKEWTMPTEYPDWCIPPQPVSLKCWSRGMAMDAWKSVTKKVLQDHGLEWS